MSDPRFARLKSDPRFRKPRKHKSKIVLDDRFKAVLSQKGKDRSGRVDKYGRQISGTQEKDDLKRFYHLDTEGQSSTAPDYARGEALLESSGEEDSDGDDRVLGDDSSDDSDRYVAIGRDKSATRLVSNDELEIDLDESEIAQLDAQAALYQDKNPEPPSGNAAEQTHRLAIVNLDWDHVRATHLFKICSSLVSPSAHAISSSKPESSRNPRHANIQSIGRGRVITVQIYPSQFGKERLAREEKEGPPPEIFKNLNDDEDVNEHNIYELGAEDDYDNDALRNYQLERLRYFYAIVTCDTTDAAVHIYNELEGTELERSANVFDMSYVPDDMTFDDLPRDEATESQGSNFQAVEFVTDALRHSKVKLTWDEDDSERHKITRRTLTKKEIEDSDFKAYLASDSEDEDENNKKASRDRLRAMLTAGDDNLPEGWAQDDRTDDVDMEITFASALSGKKDESDETTLEKYQRKMKEKKLKRKEERESKKEVKSTDEFFDMGSQDEEEHEISPTLKETSEVENHPNVDSDDGTKHFSMPAILKAEKQGKKKRRKFQKGGVDESEIQEDFVIDTKDERFAALHEDHTFAIDPSNPHFKKTKSMATFLDDRSKRQNQDPSPRSKKSSDTASSLQNLVENVKRKSMKTDVRSQKKRRIG